MTNKVTQNNFKKVKGGGGGTAEIHRYIRNQTFSILETFNTLPLISLFVWNNLIYLANSLI